MYLDNASTTKVRPECIQIITETLEKFANPSNVYKISEENKKIIADARASIAEAIGANPEDIIFTSGGSEGNAFVMAQRKHTIMTPWEHHSLLSHPNAIVVDEDYLSSVKSVCQHFGNNDMYSGYGYCHCLVNSETGKKFDLKKNFELCRELGILSACDITQALPSMKINVNELGCDIVVSSMHKGGIPKGIGFIWRRPGLKLQPLVYGSQEKAMRGGTENVPYIAAAGIGIKAIMRDMEKKQQRCKELKNMLWEALDEAKVDYFKLVEDEDSICSTASFCLAGVESEVLQMLGSDNDIYFGVGSACNTGLMERNQVLEFMNVSDKYIGGLMRISFRGDEEVEDVKKDIEKIIELYKGLIG